MVSEFIQFTCSFFQLKNMLIFSENRDVFVWGFGILGKGPDLEHSKWDHLNEVKPPDFKYI